MLDFALFDAAEPQSKRIVVSLSAPRRTTDMDASPGVMYEADLLLGPEYVPARKVYGLSPIECLAMGLASIDALLRVEHERAPLIWDDGRPYGGDYDVPVQQVVAQLQSEFMAAYSAAKQDRRK